MVRAANPMYKILLNKKSAFDRIGPVKKGCNRRSKCKSKFTVTQLIEKLGARPHCYLSGVKINLTNRDSYCFDHILPISRGGSNDIDNLGLCTPEMNAAKASKTPEEFVFLCKKVVLFVKKQKNKKEIYAQN